LEQVRQAAQHLFEDGYLLAEDLELLIDQAAERFGVAGLSAWRPTRRLRALVRNGF
jgi:hypothetical protein